MPRSTSSLPIPRSKSPALSPAMPSSSCFLNISTPVTTVFRVSRKPTISTSSPTFTLPRSIRPVTTVPRPEIEKISSIGIRNGFSISRFGIGTYSSTAFISSSICFSHLASPFSVPRAIHVRVVPLVGLILDVRRGDGDAARFLFRRVVNAVKRPELNLRVVLLQHFRDRRRQRGLAMVNMANRPHVHVRLSAFKFLFRHVLL